MGNIHTAKSGPEGLEVDGKVEENNIQDREKWQEIKRSRR